jgi:DNA-binding transcriptional LysR family regulator
MLSGDNLMEYPHLNPMNTPLRLRHLEVMLAVATAGSMQRAAQKVHLTQPAISRIIREMEAMFGAALFERSKRGVTLTECGEALAERAQYLLNDFDRTREEIRAIGKGTIGRLRIGAPPVVESTLIPKCLLALRKVAPDLRIQIEEGARVALIAALKRGEIDCVIGRLDPGAPPADLHCEKLIRTPVRIVSARNHPLADRRKVALSDLAAYPWVLPHAGSPIREVIDRLFSDAGVTLPMASVECTSIRLNYELVRGSRLIGVMTEDAATGYAAQRKLAILPIEFGDRLPYVGVMMRPGRVTHATDLFLRVLRQTCGLSG